ncbi:MAG: 4Fe-4S dicluster domain-containing protein [Acidobacteria bacterium]|nr:4Fe-4S dicluster domain-containing protein [Acidobacteriota bacterium]
MTEIALTVGTHSVLERASLDKLFAALSKRGFRLVGPTVRDGAIVYDELKSAADLPVGWTDEQKGGTYRLKSRNDGAVFGYTAGPHSWKKFLHPPAVRLWQADRADGAFEIKEEKPDAQKTAFIGVRSCDLHAIAVQDKVFLNGRYLDPYYQARRENSFIAAINCSQAGGTCFCVSMGTGPKAASGFDLALTEIREQERHYFVAEVGTELGAEILAELPHREVEGHEKAAADETVAKTAQAMGRQMDTTNIKELLYQNYEHPRWDQVAGRCLTCANCTMVCPTCFCTTVEDVTDLKGEHAERWQKWDSCFTRDFSYIHGGSIRATPKTRYRQWMTHKLATWIDQFGTSGCVGCGRCITWCPVGIDITEEVRAIREAPQSPKGSPTGDKHGNT